MLECINIIHKKDPVKEDSHLPIKTYFPGGSHPHVIVKTIGNKNLSVGITHSPKSGHHKLEEIKESTGEKAYLQHTPTFDKRSNYSSKVKSWHLTKEGEKKAIKIANKYFDKNK